jgi:hypothetical protein
MVKIRDGTIKKEFINIPIYYYLDELNIIHLDLDSINEEFNKLLDEVVLNPQNYIKV